jgi:hypothetical protein
MRARATRVDVDAASTTGPKDPDAAGYAGPHAPPSTKTVLGRRVMIHHLTNPHGREFEVMTVRKTILASTPAPPWKIRHTHTVCVVQRRVPVHTPSSPYGTSCVSVYISYTYTHGGTVGVVRGGVST